MTSPSKYTIQLLEGIHDDAHRHELANDAARLLGTNAEQLEQLLARGVGARIARAGSEKRAEHVAGLLRSVGVNVEVIAPQETDTVADALETEAASVSASSEVTAFEPTAYETPSFETPSFENPSFENSSFEAPSFETTPSLSELVNAEAQSEGSETASSESASGEPASEEAGSTWWLPNSPQAAAQTNGGSSDPFVSGLNADPFDSVIAASSTNAETITSSGGTDPFSTMLPNDESVAWTNSNDQVSAPWLNASALSANAGTVPFDAVDPFATPGASNPFADTGASNPFANSGASDPFASAIVEQYPQTSGSSDPFAAPQASGDPFGHDPYGTAGESDPFGPTGGTDPFGAAGGTDPFGPTSDTYSPTATAIRNDPFAAPMGTARDPFAPASDPFSAGGRDPFAAPHSDMLAPVISLTSTSELPPQAKAARDRAPRRSSIQTKTIVALIVPMLLIVAGVVGFLSYQLPTTITTLLRARATAVAAVTAESLRPTFDRGDVTQDSIYLLSGLAEGALLNVPYGAFFMIEHESRDVHNISTDTDLSSEGVTKYFASRVKALDSGQDKTLGDGEVVTIDGKQFIAAARQFSSISRMGNGRGYIFVGLKMDPINEALRNTLIPIFVAIGITLLLALAIGTGLARSLLRPIIAATQQAHRISLGDLDRTVPNSGNDEIGDLLVALEQMRVSLKSMVARLRRDRA
jgi:HAMP domain-containing protein